MSDDISGQPTVAVAVSGGADSLYTLLDLRKQGFRVFALHGIFLRPEDERAAEAAAGMRERLAEACGRIGVVLHTADLAERFSDLVIRPFVQSYALGLTPNPCALCNARVKFGLLLNAALALGADRLATGHYARLEQCLEDGGDPLSPALLQGRDPGKDQSYFLALVPPKALAKALFPLGDFTKADVLAALAGHDLSAPQPGESQEVCFVPGDEYREFIPRMAARFNIPLSGPGPMLLRDGRRIGTHKGLWQYTEGQRKGLGVGWKEPLHVLGKEHAGNILRLGAKDDLRLDSIICHDVNILLPPDCWPETVLVKTRYREQPGPAEARLVPAGDGSGGHMLHIRFARPEHAVAPGQIAAVYVPGREGGTTLRLAAGGVIARAEGLDTLYP
ncbi:MAG: tRNA-specific 2-thiouridylase [Desulfovibrionaceae bacterium]|nr:tRNA-specific 2-thiouridylase [Desulfovibrionaceae bacterium]